MRRSFFTPVAFAVVSGGACAPPECASGIGGQEVEADARCDPLSLLQNSLKGSGKRSAEDEDGTLVDTPDAALLQTSSHTSSGSGQRAVLPLDFFDEDASQPPFADGISAKSVPNDVGRAAVPLYPDLVVQALPRKESPAADKSGPLALSQGLAESSNPHLFFDGDDGALARVPESVSFVDAGLSEQPTDVDAQEKAFAAEVRERMQQQDEILEAKKHELALAEQQTQMQLEEQANEMADLLAQAGSDSGIVSTPSVSGQRVIDLDVSAPEPMRQPSTSSLELLVAAQRSAALRLSGVALELPPQRPTKSEEGPVLGSDEARRHSAGEADGFDQLGVHLREERLALDEKLRGLELAQQRQQPRQQPRHQQWPQQLQRSQFAKPVGGGSPPTALVGVASALVAEAHSCQPGGFGWPSCTSTGAYGPEHGSCTPQCTWQCDTPSCDEVCEPQCQPPRCETRCAAAETENCVMECDEPHCAVTCNRNQCPTHDCPSCISTCSEPMCKLRCPSAQPCRNVCEVPSCEWHCHAPEVCPEPTCHMVCEPPRNCQGDTYQQLPPLSPGELSVRSFAAPPLQDGVAQGAHVEGSVQNYDNQVEQGYTESQMRWPVQGYVPAPVQWPAAEAPIQWQAPNYAPGFEDDRVTPVSPTQARQQDPVPVQQQEQAPTQATDIEYREGYPHNLVLGAQ